MRDRGCALIIMGFMSLVFLAIGVGVGLFAAGETSREARAIAALPELDVAGFRQTANGDLVVVTGGLVDNADLASDEGFVVYWEQEWDVEYDDEDGWEGDWSTVRTVAPDCTLSFAGSRLVLYHNAEVDLDNPPHETTVYIPNSGQTVEGIVEGTIRHVGFKDDDPVTAVGHKTDGEGLTPDRLFSGDRAALVKYLQGEAVTLRIVGGIFALVAVGLMIASVVAIFRR